jgi:hypothetical protein
MNTPMSFVFNEESKVLLSKLAKIHDRSMTSVLVQLIKKESKEYGLIEARD